MTEQSEFEIDSGLQAAIDWAHSIQMRQAEKVMGSIAMERSEYDVPNPAYLEQLRKLARDAGFDDDGDEKLAEFQRQSRTKITALDEPVVRRDATKLIDELLETMASVTMPTPGRKILVSTLASGQVNALCAVNTWDAQYYHVFVDADLQTFCMSIAKIFAECLTDDDEKDRQLKFDASAEIRAQSIDIQRRAFDLFASTILTGSSRASQPWLPRKEALPLLLALGKMLFMFPLSHELAHLNLGHLDADETQIATVSGFHDFEAQIYSHAAEFQADAMGAILATETARRLGISNAATIVAPYIFLKSVELLDALFEMFSENKSGLTATHPSATDRARKMRDVIAMHMDYHRSGSILPQAIRTVDRICHHLLVGLFLQFNRLKGQGVTPRARVLMRESERGERPIILGLVPLRDEDSTDVAQ